MIPRIFKAFVCFLILTGCLKAFAQYNPIEYLEYPNESKPLAHLLPKKGVMTHPKWGYLKFPKKNLFTTHFVDFQKREVSIIGVFYNTINKQSTPLWSGHYQELGNYTYDMNELILQNLWLTELIGKTNYSDVGQGDDDFNIDIPIEMPAWIRKIGVAKPQLIINGGLDVILSGSGRTIIGRENLGNNSLWPTPQLEFKPNFTVKGKIGKHITIEIVNQDGFSIGNEVRLIYAESEKGEFEDQILQRIEAGNTSLSLPGTELTGYSENHKGLFGIKAQLKIGDVNLTAIASQDGGSQQSHTLNSQYSENEFTIKDKEFVKYKFYFLNLEDREKHIQWTINPNNTNINAFTKKNLKIYKAVTKDGKFNGISGIYATNRQPRKGNLNLVQLSEKDYIYHERSGVLEFLRPVSKTDIIAYTHSGSDGGSVNGSLIDNDQSNQVVIIKDKDSEEYDLGRLMLRNRYSVGFNEDNENNFKMTLYTKNGNPTDFLKALNIGDSVTGNLETDNKNIFNPDNGILSIPCPQKFATTPGLDSLCLNPFLALDSTTTIYETKLNRLTRAESKFHFNVLGKRKNTTISVSDNTHSINSGGCIDIAEGSEKLTIKNSGVVLTRGEDYEVLYELGQINLTSARAKDPNNEIEVKFECTPFFKIDNKFLLGLRAEYPIEDLDEGSLWAGTVLYKNQTSDAERPQLGREPYSAFLWGSNVRLKGSPNWMDRLINGVPFIDTKAKSKWSFEAEVAQSYHNPNTKSSSLLEDFESAKREINFFLSRTSWYPASPPGGTNQEITYDSRWDFRHQGDFIWHSNIRELYREVYPPTNRSRIDNQELMIMKMTLEPNDNLLGNSWGGVMKSNPTFYQNMTDYEFIELIAQGSNTKLFIDIGRISEDISINGYAPNDELDSERDIFGVDLGDRGLDGLSDDEEQRQLWNCTSEFNCSSSILTYNAETLRDPARDNYKTDRYNNSPDISINGTQGNDNDGNKSYDTEDVDRSGTLDLDNEFVRYEVDLANSADYEILQGGWRRYRIPLKEYKEIISQSGSALEDILSFTPMVRVWMGEMEESLRRAEVNIAKLSVVGNQWEDESGIVSNQNPQSNSQLVEVNGDTIRVDFDQADNEEDKVKVRVINNRDNINDYFPSPNTKIETETDSDTPLREQSLSISYKDLEPGEEAFITRFLNDEIKDLTMYRKLLMEIHLDSIGDENSENIRFGIQMGQGSYEGSSNYYEWSFRPKAFKSNQCGTKGLQQCHNDNWNKNSFAIDLEDWPNLKSYPGWTPTGGDTIRAIKSENGSYSFYNSDEYQQQLNLLHADENNKAEMISVVGNPSISKISWMRFVIYADEEGMTETDEIKGVLWLNDIRLDDVRSGWGSAARSQMQLEFGDVITITSSLNYQDGDFATLQSDLSSPKKSLSESRSNMAYNLGLNFALNKFLPDKWKVDIPMNMSYRASIDRPYTEPNSDRILSADKYGDFFDDARNDELFVHDTTEENRLRRQGESKGFQTQRETKNFSVRYKKSYVKNKNWFKDVLGQMLFERPSASYSFQSVESRSYLKYDSNYTYNTKLNYELGQFKKTSYKPFKSLKKSTWAPKILKTFSFTPWPEKLNLTLAEFVFDKNITTNRIASADSTLPRIVDYSLNLNHKVDLQWNIFSFLSTSYNLSIQRDMDDFHKAFSKNHLFSDTEGGYFAVDHVTDYDKTDNYVKIANDSVTVPDGFGGDTTVLRERVDIQDRYPYGSDYLILDREKRRTQNFKVNFKPTLFDFFPTKMTFNTIFNQNKTIDDDYDINNLDHVKRNYWTINRTNNFVLSPTLDLQKLFNRKSTQGIQKFLKKYKVQSIRNKWNVALKTTGENFTFGHLANEQGVSPYEYYLYSLGLGGENGWRTPASIFTGEMEKTERTDYKGFAQYFNKEYTVRNPDAADITPNDTIVDQLGFRYDVMRQFQTSSSITFPLTIPTQISSTLYWKEEFTQIRNRPYELDTTRTWPHYSINVRLQNFAGKYDFLKKRLKSIKASSNFEYKHEELRRAFQSLEDQNTTAYNFSPLLNVSAITRKKIRWSNSLNYSYQEAGRASKISVLDESEYPELQGLSPWVALDSINEIQHVWGNSFKIGYDLPTNKGFKFWRWYFRLKNKLNLSFTFNWNWAKTISTEFYHPDGYSPTNPMAFNQQSQDSVALEVLRTEPNYEGDGSPRNIYSAANARIKGDEKNPVHKWSMSFRPEASYQFNKKVSASSWLQYSYLKNFDAASNQEDVKPYQEHNISFQIAMRIQF